MTRVQHDGPGTVEAHNGGLVGAVRVDVGDGVEAAVGPVDLLVDPVVRQAIGALNRDI